MPRRTIYSADQASPSTYDTTFADFLDRIPQLIGGFQENQIKLGRQQLEDRRYEDEKEFRQDKYEDTLAQRKIENARQRKEFEAGQAERKRRKAEADRKHDLEEDKLIITATTPGYQRDQVMEKLGYITNETAGKNTDYRNNLRDDLDALYNIDNPWAREEKLEEITGDENYRNIFGESEFTKAINDARKNTRDYVRSHPDGLIPSDRWASVDAYEGKMDSEEEGRLLTDLKTLSKQRVEQEASGLGTVDIDNAIEARKSELDNLRQKYSYGDRVQYARSKLGGGKGKPSGGMGPLLPPGQTQEQFYAGVDKDYNVVSKEDINKGLVEENVNKALDDITSGDAFESLKETDIGTPKPLPGILGTRERMSVSGQEIAKGEREDKGFRIDPKAIAFKAPPKKEITPEYFERVATQVEGAISGTGAEQRATVGGLSNPVNTQQYYGGNIKVAVAAENKKLAERDKITKNAELALKAIPKTGKYQDQVKRLRKIIKDNPIGQRWASSNGKAKLVKQGDSLEQIDERDRALLASFEKGQIKMGQDSKARLEDVLKTLYPSLARLSAHSPVGSPADTPQLIPNPMY